MQTKQLLVIGLIVVGMACAREADEFIKPQMHGTWRGDGMIVVNWTRQTNLTVTLTISSNAMVTGKVGDAELVNGRFKRNRTAIGRKLNLATEYIVTGDLKGPIIASEGVNRSSVYIPINFQTNDCFTGGLHTSGTKFGGAKGMVLSASGFRFVRAAKSQ